MTAPDPRSCLLPLAAALLAAQLATSARAGGALARDPDFASFCAEWMQKLEARERWNLSRAKPSREGDQFVLDYIGYDREPLRCEARPSGHPGAPFVGRLVYYELRYRKRGGSQRDAREGLAHVVGRVRVLEVFRHDGRRWVY